MAFSSHMLEEAIFLAINGIAADMLHFGKYFHIIRINFK